MEFLSYGDDDDEVENAQTASITVMPLKCKWIEDDDVILQDECRSVVVDSSSPQHPNSHTGLSAHQLFSAIETPVFLIPKIEAVVQLKTFSKASDVVAHKSEEDYNAVQTKTLDRPLLRDEVSSLSANERVIDPFTNSSTRGPARHVKTDIVGGKKKKMAESSDIISAKDRVKRQRVSGQSGIGSDFREWRSEEEMRQRQQYD